MGLSPYFLPNSAQGDPEGEGEGWKSALRDFFAGEEGRFERLVTSPTKGGSGGTGQPPRKVEKKVRGGGVDAKNNSDNTLVTLETYRKGWSQNHSGYNI